MHADITQAPGATPTPRPDPAAPAASDRRLFRRYPAGLAAELLGAAEAPAPCRVTDISLGGAGLELAGRLAPPAPGTRVELRSQALAAGYAFPVEVRRVIGAKVHLSFDLDDEADFELTMSLMDSPATLEGLEAG